MCIRDRTYEDRFDDDVSEWNITLGDYQFDWFTPDLVNVCEYFEITDENKKRHWFRNAIGREVVVFDDDLTEEYEIELEDTGYIKQRERVVKRPVVRKYILTANHVLEDCGVIPGPNIPVSPMYGMRSYIDKKEYVSGHVRICKDPQRIKNMLNSSLAELSSLNQRTKPYMTPEQVAGHEYYYENDNVENFAFLPINPILNPDGSIAHIGPAAYTEQVQVPPTLAALMQQTEQDLSELLGNQQLAEQLHANTSGDAIGKVQQRIDSSSYIYICLLYTSPSPRDRTRSRMPSSA